MKEVIREEYENGTIKLTHDLSNDMLFLSNGVVGMWFSKKELINMLELCGDFYREVIYPELSSIGDLHCE